MAPHDVVDLLSSDNEAHVPLRVPPTASKPANNASETGFMHLHDDVDNASAPSDVWPDRPAKRRRLSPTLFSDDDTYTLPRLPTTDSNFAQRRKTPNAKAQKERTWAVTEESDPIVFTSSIGAGKATSHTRRNGAGKSYSDDGLSDDSLPDDIISATSRIKASALSSRTAAVLESLSQPSNRTKTIASREQRTGARTQGKKFQTSCSPSDEESAGVQNKLANPRKAAGPSKKPKLTDKEKAAIAREKEYQKASKAREKGLEKAAGKEQKAKEREEDNEKKRLLKEEKALEKRKNAAKAEVNKSKLDKKDSTPEMIVDLPASINGQQVDIQIKEFLKNLGVDSALYQSSIPNVIKWRRKMKARWDEEQGLWEPIERMEIHDEKHVACLMSATEFTDLAVAQNDNEDVETHVARLKSAYDGCTPIYIIEGLHSAMQKNKTAENRAYQAKVNSLAQTDDVPSSSQQKARKKRPAAEIVDEDIIEDALLRLQVMNGCLVHHTGRDVETAEWVANFTQHISTIPYRYISILPSYYMSLLIKYQDAAHESRNIILHGVWPSQNR